MTTPVTPVVTQTTISASGQLAPDATKALLDAISNSKTIALGDGTDFINLNNFNLNIMANGESRFTLTIRK